MKTKITLLIVTLFGASGCAQWLPASAIKQGDNEYQVTAFGNSFAGRDTLENKVDKKAEKICKKGIESKSAGRQEVRKEVVYINGYPQTNRFFAYSKTVRCKA
ncbi:MAG: hypothetical protein OXE99_05055 [Cellvibrionales bacterium]|nr:hypothetical protein [Cellvibrionales bacterium]